MPQSPIELAEWILVALGVVLWIAALVRGRALEWFGARTQLPEWRIAPSEFLAFFAALLVAMYAGPMLAVAIFGVDPKANPVPASTALLLGYAAQLSWLAVCFVFCLSRYLRPRGGAMAWVSAAFAGVAGLLLYFPAGSLAGRIWPKLLEWMHVSIAPQDSIGYLQRVSGVPEFLAWTILVVVLAPLVEEWVFRRLLFRFLSAHFPEGLAIVGSAVVFAAMHPNAVSFLPLVVLGISLCLAYRYTGRLITPIVMHAAFNLNTLVIVVFSPHQ